MYGFWPIICCLYLIQLKYGKNIFGRRIWLAAFNGGLQLLCNNAQIAIQACIFCTYFPVLSTSGLRGHLLECLKNCTHRYFVNKNLLSLLSGKSSTLHGIITSTAKKEQWWHNWMGICEDKHGRNIRKQIYFQVETLYGMDKVDNLRFSIQCRVKQIRMKKGERQGLQNSIRRTRKNAIFKTSNAKWW